MKKLIKNIIIYARISAEKQSTWSIPDQIASMKKYSEDYQYNIIDIYVDDGQSGKSFDRADWQKLEKYIRKNKGNVDAILVTNYDRFSRNLKEALAMIELMEEQFNIEIISITQPLFLDRTSPYYFKIRSSYFVDAEFERRLILDRTHNGLYRKAKEGYLLGKAPYGYRNTKNGLEIVAEEAAVIREIYKLYLSGAPQAEIYRIAKGRGYRKRGNDAIHDTLRRPAYAGLVKVPAHKGEPEQIIKGKHEGIISEIDYWKVQAMLAPKKNERLEINPEVPLKGIICCEYCGKKLTSSRSRNGANKYYWYYLCDKHRVNYSAKKAHESMERVVSKLSLPLSFIDRIAEMSSEKINSALKNDAGRVKRLEQDLRTISKNIDDLEYKYINNDIDKATYDKWKYDLSAKRYDLIKDIELINSAKEGYVLKFDKVISKLSDMLFLYRRANVIQKTGLLKLVFGEILLTKTYSYRTQHINPLFEPQLNEALAFGWLQKQEIRPFLNGNPVSREDRSSMEHLILLIRWAEDVLAA